MAHPDLSDTSTDVATAHQHDRDRPIPVVLHAAAILCLGIIAVAAPFIILRLTEPTPSDSFWWNFSMGLGFGSLGLAALQFVMTGRLRWVTHPFGADIIYVAHRYLSWGALALMLAHFGLLYVFHEPALGVLNPLEARWELTVGRVAMLCFIGLIITSELRKFLRLRHEVWRALHLTLAIVGMAAAIAHVLGVGNLTDTPAKRLFWLGATLGFVAVLIHTHLVRPLLARRNAWRVVANTAERGGVHKLELEPLGRPLARWKPGQFAWLKINRSPFSLIEHPFTISTAPEKGPNLTFSIKPLGDHTETLIRTPIGATAYVDGPYGAFSIDRMAQAEGFVMIAGGVGITPILSNLHALDARQDPRPIILIYGSPTWEEASFREELARLQHRLKLTLVHVLESPHEGWTGAQGRIDAELLRTHLPPETRDWPHLLCGPKPMLASLRTDLRGMGVTLRHIDYEIFEMV